MLMFRPM